MLPRIEPKDDPDGLFLQGKNSSYVSLVSSPQGDEIHDVRFQKTSI